MSGMGDNGDLRRNRAMSAGERNAMVFFFVFFFLRDRLREWDSPVMSENGKPLSFARTATMRMRRTSARSTVAATIERSTRYPSVMHLGI